MRIDYVSRGALNTFGSTRYRVQRDMIAKMKK